MVKWKPTYIPTEEDLKDRTEAVRWLVNRGFDPLGIEAIMSGDELTLECVHRLVRKHGIEEAKSRIKEMLED